jgi:hypothetical protein
MILLQILAFLLLIPMTLGLLLVFNIFLLNWTGISIILFFGVMYSLLFGLLFLSWNAAIIIFILLAIGYFLRIKSLSKKIHRIHPVIRFILKDKKEKIKLDLMMQLSFLKILKLMPNSASIQLSEQLNLHIQIPELIELFLKGASGTRVDIVTDDVILFFEIQ